MTDYEELRDEMQYYENEHYNELRKLEEEENASPTLKADRDAWKARAEIAEAELKEAVEAMERITCGNDPCDYCEYKDACWHRASCPESKYYWFKWRGAREEGTK